MLDHETSCYLLASCVAAFKVCDQGTDRINNRKDNSIEFYRCDYSTLKTFYIGCKDYLKHKQRFPENKVIKISSSK